MQFCIVAVCYHAISVPKAALCKKNAYLQGARDVLTACYIVAYAAKLPMCENKIYATRERRMIALCAKRRCAVVPYAF
nr:hypothetical protein [uncultured Campylobacter sp.]